MSKEGSWKKKIKKKKRRMASRDTIDTKLFLDILYLYFEGKYDMKQACMLQSAHIYL